MGRPCARGSWPKASPPPRPSKSPATWPPPWGPPTPRRVIHRDIKPQQHVLFGGIARRVQAHRLRRARRHGRTRRDPRRHRPRHARLHGAGAGPRRQDVDARADVFALGCVSVRVPHRPARAFAGQQPLIGRRRSLFWRRRRSARCVRGSSGPRRGWSPASSRKRAADRAARRRSSRRQLARRPVGGCGDGPPSPSHPAPSTWAGGRPPRRRGHLSLRVVFAEPAPRADDEPAAPPPPPSVPELAVRLAGRAARGHLEQGSPTGRWSWFSPRPTARHPAEQVARAARLRPLGLRASLPGHAVVMASAPASGAGPGTPNPLDVGAVLAEHGDLEALLRGAQDASGVRVDALTAELLGSGLRGAAAR